MEITEKDIIAKSLSKAMDFEAYMDLMERLEATERSTGPDQTEALVNYTKLNTRRMQRWNKTLQISDDTQYVLKLLDREVTFLVITESWCGDAAHALPVFQKIAELSTAITLKIVLRDENEALMEKFLTNGSRSIPKLIILDSKTNEILGDWGPRPKDATLMVKEFKEKNNAITPELKQDLQVWYNKNKGRQITEEILALLPLEEVCDCS